jgi:membrane fusion protein, heavy metal efflux system
VKNIAMKNIAIKNNAMKNNAMKNIISISLSLLTMIVITHTHAHGDHDAPAATAGSASPRFDSHSDLFELVGIYERGALALYLDRYATNEPVKDAKIEFEMGSVKGIAQAQADGTYRIDNDALKNANAMIGLTFTVTAGSDIDLLSGNLDLAPAAAATPRSHAGHSHADQSHTKQYVAIALGVLGLPAIISLIFFALKRRKDKSGYLNAIGAMALIGCITAALPPAVFAHEGHDHGEGKVSMGNNPSRQPDGSVFLPKPSQRQLNVRTVLITQALAEAAHARSVELNGTVIADPSASGKVQATQSGRIELIGKVLPSIGTRVTAGQALAVIRPSISTVERGSQAAQSAELKIALDLAKKKLARLEQLEGTVPQRDIEAARFEVQSLTERSRAISGALVTTETLRAPVSGVISAVNVSIGQVVDAREVAFEIIDPSRLRIEAIGFDASLLSRIKSATAMIGDQSYELQLMGAARSLREGALPMQFGFETMKQETAKFDVPLVVGQPVKVFVTTNDKLKGVRLPAQSLVKSQNNQTTIWTHDGAERFVAVAVTAESLDGQNVVVTSGVKAAMRVVTSGASFVNQVR